MPILEIVDFVFGALLAVLIVVLLIWFWLKDREELKELATFAYAMWLFVGWAPSFFLLDLATTQTVFYVGLGMLITYGLAWLPIAASN